MTATTDCSGDSLNGGPGTDVCLEDARLIDSFAQCETMHTRQIRLSPELKDMMYTSGSPSMAAAEPSGPA